MKREKTFLGGSWIGLKSRPWLLSLLVLCGGTSCTKDAPDLDDPVSADDSIAENLSETSDEAKDPSNDTSVDNEGAIISAELTGDDQGATEGEATKTLASIAPSDVSGSTESSYESGSDSSSGTEAAAKKLKRRKFQENGNNGFNEALTTSLTNPPFNGPTASYVVVAGDSLTKIAKKIYGHTKFWLEIAAANDLAEPFKIFPGNGLKYPLSNDSAKTFADTYRKNQKTVTVQRGDSLSKIAAQVFGNPDSWRKLFNINKDKIRDPNVLPAGITLAYFDGSSGPESETKTEPAAQVQASVPSPSATPETKPAVEAKPVARSLPSTKKASSKLGAKKLKAKELKSRIKVSPRDLYNP